MYYLQEVPLKASAEKLIVQITLPYKIRVVEKLVCKNSIDKMNEHEHIFFPMQKNPNFSKALATVSSQVLKEVLIRLEYNAHADRLLEKGLLLSVASAIQALYDRALNPLSPEHFIVYTEILAEIQQIYLEIKDKLVDEDTWLNECCDYSVKKVYYLDWKLYLSQISY